MPTGTILIPFCSVKVCWRGEDFADLGEFEGFLSERFPTRFRSMGVGERGYFIRDESAEPAVLLSELEAQLRSSGRAPYECSFKLLYLAVEEQRVAVARP